jgi:hypothetical protein
VITANRQWHDTELALKVARHSYDRWHPRPAVDQRATVDPQQPALAGREPVHRTDEAPRPDRRNPAARSPGRWNLPRGPTKQHPLRDDADRVLVPRVAAGPVADRHRGAVRPLRAARRLRDVDVPASRPTQQLWSFSRHVDPRAVRAGRTRLTQGHPSPTGHRLGPACEGTAARWLPGGYRGLAQESGQVAAGYFPWRSADYDHESNASGGEVLAGGFTGRKQQVGRTRSGGVGVFRFNSRVLSRCQVCHSLVGRRMKPLVWRGAPGRIPDKDGPFCRALCSFRRCGRPV